MCTISNILRRVIFPHRIFFHQHSFVMKSLRGHYHRRRVGYPVKKSFIISGLLAMALTAAAAASEPGPMIVLPEGATVDDVFTGEKKTDLFHDNTLQRSPRQIGNPRELVSGESCRQYFLSLIDSKLENAN